MSWVKGKSPGWAAFDRKQHTKGLQTEIDAEPFPFLPTTFSSQPRCENSHSVNGYSERSFSSILPSAESLARQETYLKKTILGNSSVQDGMMVEETTDVLAIRRLKDLHSWADINLIEDILEAVNNNISEACTLLKTLGPSCSSEKTHEMSILGMHFFDDLSYDGNNISMEKTRNLPVPSSTIKDVHQNNNVCNEDDTPSSENNYQGNSFEKKINYHESNFSHKVDNSKLALDSFKSVLIEPEWEEDDVYLNHRKDAIAMIRSASQHSRAATNAYLRNDHASAQYHSLRSQEQWLTAKMLNDKAAREILQTRNGNNGLWKLDLHGLHAAEAVQALQEHLQKIGTQNFSNRSISSPRKAEKKGIRRASSLESFSCMDKLDKTPSFSRRRPTSLEVITGLGKHSKGEAALPTAVTRFLSENGYHFEQLRPGVISVRPKFQR